MGDSVNAGALAVKLRARATPAVWGVMPANPSGQRVGGGRAVSVHQPV
jgi:hypothetical protein